MNLKKLLVGHPIRLKYVTRFSTCRTLHKESVAEHIFFTTLYCQVLGQWVENNCEQKVDFSKLLLKALIHDLEESITGDIPRDFKHLDAQLNKDIDKLAARSFQQVVQGMFQNTKDEELWYDAWLNAKDSSLEGRILTFADFLSVISYIYEETRIAKSLVLQEQLTSLEDYYLSFLTPEYKFLNPLILQVGEILHKEILYEVD